MMACETGYLPIVKYLAEELVELDVNRQLPEVRKIVLQTSEWCHNHYEVGRLYRFVASS